MRHLFQILYKAFIFKISLKSYKTSVIFISQMRKLMLKEGKSLPTPPLAIPNVTY